ncbi:MAG: DnaD domain protein [Oscillospiraceae bacterium]|nr:DnaD domain protein [Oscillospiraceae bacterium]
MQINYGSHVFAVPGDVVDHFIRLADERQIKVLLCLLRSDGNADAAQIASYLKMDPEQVEDALQFWVQANVLDNGESAAASGFAFAAPAPAAAPAAPAAQPAEQQVVVVHGSSKEIKLDPSEIDAMIQDSKELADLFSMAEKLMGKPLNHMDHRSLVWMQSYLHLPTEVILTLLGYCVSIEKFSISYAEAIAVHWEKDGINTLPLAEEAVEQMRTSHTYEAELRRMFEMKRSPTTKQKEFFDRWKAAGFSMELLHHAYEVTVENTEKLNFPYMDKLLTNWTEQGAATPEQVKALPKPGAAQKPAASRKKAAEPVSPQLMDKLNDYLSVVNRFKEDEE